MNRRPVHMGPVAPAQAPVGVARPPRFQAGNALPGAQRRQGGPALRRRAGANPNARVRPAAAVQRPNRHAPVRRAVAPQRNPRRAPRARQAPAAPAAALRPGNPQVVPAQAPAAPAVAAAPAANPAAPQPPRPAAQAAPAVAGPAPPPLGGVLGLAQGAAAAQPAARQPVQAPVPQQNAAQAAAPGAAVFVQLPAQQHAPRAPPVERRWWQSLALKLAAVGRKIKSSWQLRELRKFSLLNVVRSFFLAGCLAAFFRYTKWFVVASVLPLLAFMQLDCVVGLLPGAFLPQMWFPYNYIWGSMCFVIFLISALVRRKLYTYVWMPFFGNMAVIDRSDPDMAFLLEDPVNPAEAMAEFERSTRILANAVEPEHRFREPEEGQPIQDVRPTGFRDKFPWEEVVQDPTVKIVQMTIGTLSHTFFVCMEFYHVLAGYMNVQMDQKNPVSSKAARDGHNARYNFTGEEWTRVSNDTVLIAKYYYKTNVMRCAAVEGGFDAMVKAAAYKAHDRRYWDRMAKRKGPGYVAVLIAMMAATMYHTAAGLGYNYLQLPEQMRATAMPAETVGQLTIPPQAEEAMRNEDSHIGGEVSFPLLPASRMYANPTPDFSLTSSIVAALKYRLMTAHPVDGPEMAAFSRFVAEEVAKFEPVDVMTPEEWLESTHYSQDKKAEILEVLNGQRNGTINSAFVKRECYPSYKAPRAIINASQEYKNIEGPVVASIQPLFESLPESLAGVPVKDWGHTVIEAFDEIPFGDTYVTDYSSFESSFGKELKKACEDQFYARMVQDPSLRDKLASVQEGVRKVVAKNGVVYIRQAGRFSGDQRTYQGNTITNIMVARYVLSKHNILFRMFACGDDGLIRVPRGTIMPLEEYARLGLKLKLKKTDVGSSDFCGFCFNPDSKGTRIAKDPMSVLLDLFRSYVRLRRKRALDYLWDKAMCYRHEYPHDPVLRPIMDLIIERYRKGRSAVPRNWWTQQVMKDADVAEDVTELETMAFASEVTGLPEVILQSLRDAALEAVSSEDLDKLYDFIESYDVECNEVRWSANHLESLVVHR